jgi:hypothetical protein
VGESAGNPSDDENPRSILAQGSGMKKDRGLLARVPPMGCEIVERVETDPTWEIGVQCVREGIGGRAAVQWGGERGEGAVRNEESVEGLEWVGCGASRPNYGRWSVRERGFGREMG